jgi:hypothetical protein
MQLADLDARVVEVENPAGPDPVRATGPGTARAEAALTRFQAVIAAGVDPAAVVDPDYDHRGGAPGLCDRLDQTS